MTDETQDQQEDLFDDNNGDDTDSGSGQPAAPPNDGSAGGASNSDQRINDLMSKWQAEQARANRLEAQLKGRGDAGGGETKDDAADASTTQRASDWERFLAETARNQLYDTDPRLAKYGVEKSAITGSTPAELQASFEAQRRLVDAMESRIRNAVLAEHGIEPEVGGGAGEPGPNFATMSKEEFEKHVARATGRE